MALLVAGCGGGAHGAESATGTQVAETGTATATAAPEYVAIPHVPPPAGGIVPGAAVDINRDGHMYGCTLGPAVRQKGTSRTGFLTAGHCAGDASVGGVELGPVEAIVDTQSDCACETLPSTLLGEAEDSGIIWTPRAGDPGTGTIAGHSVTGAMSEEALKTLPQGTQVCSYGSTSGTWCTTLFIYSSSPFIGASGGDHGDSGGATFVVSPAGDVTLIGTVDDKGRSSIIGRAMRRLDLEPITAP